MPVEELPKPPKQLPRTILSLEQINELPAQPDTATPNGLRDRCIMELFYGTGIRCTELANLKPYDVDLNRGILAFQSGKGNKDRNLPLGEAAKAWLEKYLDEARDGLTGPLDDDRLFITDYGEPFDGGHPHAGERRGYPVYPGDTGTWGHQQHPSLYAGLGGEKLRAVHAATHPRSLKCEEEDKYEDREDRARS